MEKRVFLAIVLSFAVLTLYQVYLAPPPPAPPIADVSGVDAPSSVADGTTATPPQALAAETTGQDPAVQETPQAVAEPTGAQPLVAATEDIEVVVETDAIRAVFATRGAVLTSWRLKNYADRNGERLDLVPKDLPATLPRPFTMATDDQQLSATLSSALFRPSETSLTLTGESSGVLTFDYQDSAGLTARKTFHFQPDGQPYLLNVEASIDVNGTARPVTIDWGPALSFGYRENSSEIDARALMFRNDDIERIGADTLLEQPGYSGPFDLVGVEEHYFMTVALPGPQQNLQVEYQPMTLAVPGGVEGEERRFVDFRLSVPGAATLQYFLGPKDFEILRSVDPQFTRAIDFGIFAALVVPLLQALRWVHDYVGNWGFSIILLTVMINLLISPLRHRSMVSMRKMQAIQPEIKGIQERYKKFKVTDPERQKMNQEMMALYKQKGVNPASGCVPMLLTMPILFAFYAMLLVAIEVRDAPFIGWVHDLSARDPYFVWPILMGATMFLQQRMSPTTADPVQAKVFMFMPIMFTFMFLWFPAGLVIYWLTSNVMAIGQQYVTNRMIGPPPKPGAAAVSDQALKAAKPVKPTKAAVKQGKSKRKQKS